MSGRRVLCLRFAKPLVGWGLVKSDWMSLSALLQINLATRGMPTNGQLLRDQFWLERLESSSRFTSWDRQRNGRDLARVNRAPLIGSIGVLARDQSR